MCGNVKLASVIGKVNTFKIKIRYLKWLNFIRKIYTYSE